MINSKGGGRTERAVRCAMRHSCAHHRPGTSCERKRTVPQRFVATGQGQMGGSATIGGCRCPKPHFFFRRELLRYAGQRLMEAFGGAAQVTVVRRAADVQLGRHGVRGNAAPVGLVQQFRVVFRQRRRARSRPLKKCLTFTRSSSAGIPTERGTGLAAHASASCASVKSARTSSTVNSRTGRVGAGLRAIASKSDKTQGPKRPWRKSSWNLDRRGSAFASSDSGG